MLSVHEHYIRPMLGVTKDEIIGFMTSSGFEWQEDLSNKETMYKRNSVRHNLVPQLAELAGSHSALHK